MFQSRHWAAALVNSLENEGRDVEDGIEIFKALASWAKKLPGEVFGSYAAGKAESLIREAMTGAGSFSAETAIRFFALAVKKNKTRYLDSIAEEAKKILDKKRGVITASVEYAFPIDGHTESEMKEEIRKRTGAARVDLSAQVNAGLIGGYRLRIGDEIIDASIQSQLRKLLAALQSGQTGQAYGGN